MFDFRKLGVKLYKGSKHCAPPSPTNFQLHSLSLRMLLDTRNSSIRQPLIILVAFAILVKLAFISWMYHVPLRTERQEYSRSYCYVELEHILIFRHGNSAYIGDDHPSTWNIDLGDPIVMPFESSAHFNLTDEGTIEWESLTPENGLIYLGKERRPFSISMFHQLRCLAIMRKRIINLPTHISPDAAPDPLIHHCINYIRQMVLCRSDVTLEQTYAPPTAVKNNAQICNNWERVYEEQMVNHKE